MDDGTELSPDDIKEVQSLKEDSIVQASYLIGKKATWLDGSGNEASAIIRSVSMKNGKVLFSMNDENQTSITQDQIVSVEDVSLP